MGLILGAIIASALVLISAEDKAKIIKKIKNKFKNIFDDKIGRDARSGVSTVASEIPKKISVTLPSDVETLNLTPQKTLKPKKVFKKSK